jgi:hypothetical protein
MPQILNAKNFMGGFYPPNSVYVGRNKTSILGNPYTHNSTKTLAEFIVSTRDEAVEMFEQYARKRIKEEQDLYPHDTSKQIFINAIKALKDKDLICWCAPLRCHAEVLIVLCEELTKEM